MAWPCHPASHPPALVQVEHPRPLSVTYTPSCRGVMQGMCHEGTASSAPVTSPTSCSPLLAGLGWGVSHFHMALAKNLCPALSWWEPGALCPGVHHSVRPRTRAGWQRGVSLLPCPSVPRTDGPSQPVMEMSSWLCPSCAGTGAV